VDAGIFMDIKDIKKAHEFSINNRKQVEESETAGCFYCLNIFEPKEIYDYCDDDKTVICPKCGIDSVLGSKSGYPINKETLKKLYKYWFARRVRL